MKNRIEMQQAFMIAKVQNPNSLFFESNNSVVKKQPPVNTLDYPQQVY